MSSNKGSGGNIKDNRMGDASLAFNTKPAILRNTSGQRYVFVAPALKAGAGGYQKTYVVEQGKDCEVQAEDFIRMRWEIERLVAANKLMIVRGVASEVRTNDEFGTMYLKSRPDDPTPDELENNMFWIVDKGTGNNIPNDIDMRVRLNGVTYSVFDTVAIGTIGYILDFVIADWILNGAFWELDVTHNLNTPNATLSIYENDLLVWTHNVRRTGVNSHKLLVPALPDLRFNGQIVLVKPN